MSAGRGDPFLKNKKDGRNVFHYVATLDEEVAMVDRDSQGEEHLHSRKIKTLDTLVSYIGRERRSGPASKLGGRKRIKQFLKEADFKGKTPLHTAVESLKFEIREVRKGRRPPQAYRWKDDKNFVKHIMKLYCELFSGKGMREILTKPDDVIATPLHYAAQLITYPALLRLMLASGGDVNLQV